MTDRKQHRMTLESSFPSGAQQWLCPTCSHRILIGVQRGRLEIMVLERGDELALHSGSAGASIEKLEVGEARPAAFDNRTVH
jgi:hypothetical protein